MKMTAVPTIEAGYASAQTAIGDNMNRDQMFEEAMRYRFYAQWHYTLCCTEKDQFGASSGPPKQ